MKLEKILNPIKRIAKAGLILAVLTAPFSLNCARCDDESKAVLVGRGENQNSNQGDNGSYGYSEDDPLSAPRTSQSYSRRPVQVDVNENLPLWDAGDLEINKYNKQTNGEGGVMTVTTKVLMRPEFYTGEMPLRYQSIKTPDYGGGYGGSLSKTLLDKFDDFSIAYVYENYTLIGAVAVAGGEMVAEAKIRYVKKGDNPIVSREGEEVHYFNGIPIFHCKSEFDLTGFKKSESNVSGRKMKDYFSVIAHDY